MCTEFWYQILASVVVLLFLSTRADASNLCFECTHANIGQCKSVSTTFCSANQNCFAREDFLGGNKYYTFGCMDKSKCTPSDCCCPADLCNTATCPVAKDCGTPQIANSNITTAAGTQVNAQATVTCNPGYSLTGGNLTCQANGTWSYTGGPTCTIKDCGTPQIANSNITTAAGTQVNAQATVTCNPGYSLTGGNLTCQANGIWSYTGGPTCTIKDCGAPYITNSDITTAAGTLYQAQGTVKCKTGYTQTGGDKITCQPDGKWNYSGGPTCTIKDCGTPQIPNSVITTPAGTKYQAQGTVTCKTGYTQYGGNQVTCQSNGKWKSTGTTCTIKDCGTPQIPNSVINTPAGTKYQAQGTVTCKTGYTQSGGNQVTCQADGKWKYTGTTCTIKDCGTPQIPNSVINTPAGTKYQAQGTVTCKTGYTQSGGNQVTCQANGKWKYTGTTCTIKATPKPTPGKKNPTAMCSCVGDPHCQTLDRQLTGGPRYNYYKVGEFVMYKSTSRKFEVQVRTWQCRKPVTCNCAVTMREGNDVITIDACNSKSPKVTYPYQHKLSPGIHIRNPKKNEWKVKFPSGAWVKVTGGGKVLHIYIHAPSQDFGSTTGLCGNFDGNIHNDLIKKNGVIEKWSSKPDAFVESWRLVPGTSMFDRKPIDLFPIFPIAGRSADDVHQDDQLCPNCHSVAIDDAMGGQRTRKAVPHHYGRFLYDYDYGVEIVMPQPITNFPTRSRKTKNIAEKTCRDAFAKVSTLTECVTRANISFSSEIDMCVEDIKVSDGEMFVSSAIDAAVTNCRELVLTKLSYYDNGTTGPLPTFITTDVCSRYCSGNGACVNDTCVCNQGFVGEECEIDSTKPPSVYNIVSTDTSATDATICDVTVNSCQTIHVVGSNLMQSNTSRCLLEELEFNGSAYVPKGRNHTVTVDFQSMDTVGCKMPSESAVGGRSVIGYRISVTNDGIHYSNTTQVMIVNSTCMSCSATGEHCNIKPHFCLIGGNCQSDGEASPLDASMVCNPLDSKKTWTAFHSTSKPITDQSTPSTTTSSGYLVTEVRFDIWTMSKSGCPCKNNSSNTDCACCDDGACQCPGRNFFQCVECGHEERCGRLLPAPDHGYDGYTLSTIDCPCPYDQSRFDCACCQNGGCQCGIAHRNQCVECKHMENCGSKPWIFGHSFPSN